MPQHVIVDGSNLATEGRTLPSLKQLNEAIAAYREDHPDALITVVVDATFGHRIDSKEGPAFERAIETNAFVAPPAGAVGRGDGFILSIAEKVHASILSNDSYQEFHGEYAWLFDEGRLIGGKPVPHVGWVFVNRVPVRGATSRRSVKEQKVVDKSPGRGRSRKQAGDSAPAISADGPMPVPKSPPPGAVMPGQHSRDAKPARQSKAAPEQNSSSPKSDVPRTGHDGRQHASAPKSANDLLAFLSFVEHYPVGTAVTAVVESYSSHGAYVAIGDAKGYVPLRLMAEPAPRSAREVMAIGETVTLVVSSFGPARRSIDLAVPAMAPPAPPVATPKVRKSAAKNAAAKAAKLLEADSIFAEAIATDAVQAAASVVPAPAASAKARKTPARKSADSKKPTQPGIAAEPKKQAARRKPAAATSEPEQKPTLVATFESVFEDQATAEQPAVPVKRSRAPRRETAGSAAKAAAHATPPAANDRIDTPDREAAAAPTPRPGRKSGVSKAGTSAATQATPAPVPTAKAAKSATAGRSRSSRNAAATADPTKSEQTATTHVAEPKKPVARTKPKKASGRSRPANTGGGS